MLQSDPWQIAPPFEKLVGDLAGAYSRRINIRHRLVYQVLEAEKAVKILRLWTPYELSFSCVAKIIRGFGNGNHCHGGLTALKTLPSSYIMMKNEIS